MKDSWTRLKHFTQARIALGRSGHAQPTKAQLDFQLAHAQARDAIHIHWNLDLFAENLKTRTGFQCLKLESQVRDRREYLLRPDLGRKLKISSINQVMDFRKKSSEEVFDLSLVVTNGLSSLALEKHGIPLIENLFNKFYIRNFKLSPICLLANGRVAIADEIGHLFNSKLTIIIVGERPGLSVPDSLGIYMTYSPEIGKTDADRNCISNIHQPGGLTYEEASEKALYLCEMALIKKLSGVHLKDEMLPRKSTPVFSIT